MARASSSRGVVGLASLVALLLGAAVPASAGAAWTAPVALGQGYQPQIAVDADGDAVFTWTYNDGTNTRIRARARSAAGALSPIQTLSAAGQNAQKPQVAVDADGDAVFTWERFDGTHVRIQAVARSAAGALSPVQTLSDSAGAGGDAHDPQVGVDADGDAVFTWWRFESTFIPRIQARARSAAGALSPIQTLSSISGNGLYPEIAVDLTGDAVITWNFFDGDWDRVQARARSAAGVLSAVQTLTPTGRNAGGPRVGVDADGDAVIGYSEEPNPDQASASFRGQARARSAAGVLSPAQTVSPPPEGGVHGVAVDADGDAVFIWDLDNPDSRIQARARSAAGALSPLKTLGKSSLEPQVALGGGDAAVVWNDAGYIKAAFGP
jgi:hypothetical protein